MKTKFVYVLLVVALMLALTPVASAAPNGATTCDQDYTVTAGDWLSKLSDKFLGNVKAYFAIMAQTNYKNAEDSSYAKVTNPDVLEVGQKLCIPSKADAEAFLAKFDPNKGNIDLLFAKPAAGQLLVGNWWTSGGEFAGINGVYELYKKAHPGVEVVHGGIAGGGGVNFKAANLTKLQGGDPFDVFMLHAGAEVEQYDPAKYLTPVEAIVEKTQGSVMPEDLKKLLTYEGHIYTVPMNIHRGNVLWVNKKVLADNGLKTPTTWDEFFTVAEALKGKGIVPLSHGGANGFEAAQTFEVVLMSYAGADGMAGLTGGTKSWSSPEVTQALETYKKVLTYTNADRNALSWDQATKLVIEGKAAMNIMGDWANGEFKVAGKTDADYEGVPAPGNKGMFMLVSDGFAMPLQAPNKANAEAWLEMIATKEAQETFNINKGSICSRTDCDYSAFDTYLKSSAADFKVSRVLPTITHGSAIVPSWQAAYYDIIKLFEANGDVAAAQAALVQAAKDAGAATP
mgnify:FL=1